MHCGERDINRVHWQYRPERGVDKWQIVIQF
jgi:hypothetical protein